MLELLIIHWKSFLQILFILIISAVIIGYLYYNQFKDIVRENWAELRTRPFFMMFGSFFYTEPGKTIWGQASENLNLVINQITKTAVDVFTLPFTQLANGAIVLLRYFQSILDGLRAQFAVIRNMMFGLVNSVYQRITNVTGAMSVSLLKVREGLKKQVGLFNLLTWTVAHSYYFLYSLMTGPVGMLMNITARLALPAVNFAGGTPLSIAYVSTLCFHPNSPIITSKGITCIQNINVNDLLINNNRVIAKLKIDTTGYNTILYNKGKIGVTGDHLFLDQKWKRVKDIGWKEEEYRGDLYCLITENGLIETEVGIFADFLETIDPIIQWNMRKLSLNFLNSPTEYIDNGDRIWGFSPETIIDGKRIEDIEAGEYINGKKVMAKIEIAEKSMIMYEYEGLLIGGNVCVLDGHWKRIYSIGKLKGLNQNKCYNLIIEDSEIEIGGKYYRDYLEVDNEEWNRIVDKNVETWMNREISHD